MLAPGERTRTRRWSGSEPVITPALSPSGILTDVSEPIDAQHPTTRVLALLELLQAHHRLDGTELAERLGVDPRTVRRYATRLADLGIPVEAERGRYGGYRLRPGYKLPPLMFTDAEATAVVLGLLTAQAAGVATSTSAAATESALAKLLRVLPDAVRDQIAAVPTSLGLALPERTGATPPTAVVLSLAGAAHQRRRIRMRYQSRSGERTERVLDPYGLVVHGGRWYVAGLDHRRDEVRTFRLDRILDVDELTETFTRPDDFDPVDHVARSLARVPWSHEVEVVLHAPLADVRRRIPLSVGEVSEVEGDDDAERDGGRVLVRMRAERLDGVARMLAGLGWPFVILRPDELRTAVTSLARALQAAADEVHETDEADGTDETARVDGGPR
jgi:predicted DNA-binding transcriptional regulator YafY